MMVIARPGLKVPLEDDARRYITDGDPVDVVDGSVYYLRRLHEGDLVPAPAPAPSGTAPEPAVPAEKNTTPSLPARKAAVGTETGADTLATNNDKQED
ncbi:Uncharacterised protein [Cedecea neteri]|uniref:DUF2635 domain-containing protein n=1 Tax=Cedecea neteri TaxID=158822 RepID=A0A2X3J952_9ENTR|nr:hypothetical protein [Cedecea neteri]SQA96730.1 Uncharacterised protein [Cedecea neteri]SQC92521.1 Uncharacterised protein [Cedecea neteri]SQC93412.1 Uncharacterised protein [Cedecea neteri]